jgi:uncharacterized protein (TIGR03382 family)
LLNAAGMQRTIVLLSLLVISSASASPHPPPVVGGTKVAQGTWPDVVAVLGELGSCSGTLIAPDVVLTAGHCIDIEPTLVIANTIDFEQTGGPGERIAVKWARAYPSWEDRFDVAVVMLDHVAKPRPRAIATACLANKLLGERAPVTVVGFGLTSPSGTDDNTALHQAVLPVLDPVCGSDPGCNPDVRPNGEFTAGGRGMDSCMGDSGGPAMIGTPKGPALVGVVSRGLALPGRPCGNGGVYVRADKVVAWIEAVTGRDLERSACDRQADDPEADPEEDAGGCSATGGGGSLLVGMMLIAAVWRRRATGEPGARPDPRGPVVRAEAHPAGLAAGDRAAWAAAGSSPHLGRERPGMALDPCADGGDRSG